MAFDYINEAFKKLQLLDESMFDTSSQGVNELANFLNATEDEVVTVIDPAAEGEEDLQTSYVGKVILNCNVCHSNTFKDKEEIVIEEDGSVNIETQCPYCGESEGFVIIGEIAPFNNGTDDQTTEDTEEPTDNAGDETPVVDSEDSMNEALGIGAGLALGGAAIGAGNVISKLVDDVNDETEDDTLVEEEDPSVNKTLRMSRASKRVAHEEINEDFKEVSIKTEDQKLEMTSDENGKVTVVTEPISNDESSAITAEETIVPISDETEEEILQNNDITDSSEEESSEEDLFAEEPSEEEEFDFDDIDEEGLDELGESYLKNVYENVSSFKTTEVSTTPTQLIVEGIITFDTNATKKTGFIFEACDMNSRGQLRFTGTNKHFTESKDAYSLIGRVDNKKLFVESLKYNYKTNNTPVRGIVRRR